MILVGRHGCSFYSKKYEVVIVFKKFKILVEKEVEVFVKAFRD